MERGERQPRLRVRPGHPQDRPPPEHDPYTRIQLGDTLAVTAVRGDLVAYDARSHMGMEADDSELLGYRTETLHVVITRRSGGRGHTIRTLRHEEFMPGVFIEGHWRAGADLRVRLDATVERGDTLILTGSSHRVDAAAAALGKPVPTSFATDMVWIALGLSSAAAWAFRPGTPPGRRSPCRRPPAPC